MSNAPWNDKMLKTGEALLFGRLSDLNAEFSPAGRLSELLVARYVLSTRYRKGSVDTASAEGGPSLKRRAGRSLRR